MKFQDTKWWQNYHEYDKIVHSSSMRSTIDGLIYWKLLNKYKFNSFLEIGVYQGLTTGLFFESNHTATVVTVDPVQNLELFYKNYSEFQNQFVFINQRSQTADFGSDKFDFILIDGDHSYQAARHDIFKCLPYLTASSVLAIDDYQMPGVAKAIKDLYNANNDWVPFLQAEQTQFWHHRSYNREEFIDSLFIDPLSNFVFVENIVDHANNTICSAKTLSIFTNIPKYFDLALKQYNI
jgi:predicted O-methyltransferase YrrM